MTGESPKAGIPYLELLEELAWSHPRLTAVLQKAEHNRKNRLDMLKSGARLRGLEELLRELEVSESIFRETSQLRPAATLLRRAIGYYQIGVEASLSGLHSVVLDSMRSVMEIEFLLRDFAADANLLTEWLGATERERYKRFRPAVLRQRHAKRLGSKPEDMCEAVDYKAHSETLHVGPRPHPIAGVGIAGEVGFLSDACFWEMYEHGRRLLWSIELFAHNAAPGTKLNSSDDMSDFRNGLERTQEMQGIFIALLQTSSGQSTANIAEAGDASTALPAG